MSVFAYQIYEPENLSPIRFNQILACSDDIEWIHVEISALKVIVSVKFIAWFDFLRVFRQDMSQVFFHLFVCFACVLCNSHVAMMMKVAKVIYFLFRDIWNE